MIWLYAFLLTCAIELPIVVMCAGPCKSRRSATDSLAANLVTHPTAWYLVRSMLLPWLAIELVVAAAELLIYRGVTKLSWQRATAAAVLANGATAAISFVV